MSRKRHLRTFKHQLWAVVRMLFRGNLRWPKRQIQCWAYSLTHRCCKQCGRLKHDLLHVNCIECQLDNLFQALEGEETP